MHYRNHRFYSKEYLERKYPDPSPESEVKVTRPDGTVSIYRPRKKNQPPK